MLAISKFKDRVRGHHIKSKSVDLYKVLHIQEGFFELFTTVAEIRKDEEFLNGRLSDILEQQYLETIHEVLEIKQENSSKEKASNQKSAESNQDGSKENSGEAGNDEETNADQKSGKNQKPNSSRSKVRVSKKKGS